MIRAVLVFALFAMAVLVTVGPQAAWVRASRRVFFLVVLLAGSVAVYDPDLVQKAANLLNVGRGTDLVLYFVTVFVLGLSFALYTDRKRQERREARLVQEIALLAARVDALDGAGPRPDPPPASRE